jgi:hypothetical protein
MTHSHFYIGRIFKQTEQEMSRMEQTIISALPYLAKDIQFHVEKDSYIYENGTKSFLTIHIYRRGHSVSVYFFPSGNYKYDESITQEEKSILDGWIAVALNKKN